jgi:hypothetical protein
MNENPTRFAICVDRMADTALHRRRIHRASLNVMDYPKALRKGEILQPADQSRALVECGHLATCVRRREISEMISLPGLDRAFGAAASQPGDHRQSR